MDANPLTQALPPFAALAVEALGLASGMVPPGRAALDAHDLVLGVLALDSSAARIVDVLAPGRIAEVEAEVRAARSAAPGDATAFGEIDLPDGSTIAFDASVREVLDHILTAIPSVVDTKSLLCAEAARTASALVAALASVGAGGTPDALAPQIAAIARRTADDPRTGARRLVYRPLGTLPSAAPPRDRTSWTGPVDRSPAPGDAASVEASGAETARARREDRPPGDARRDTASAPRTAAADASCVDLIAVSRASGNAAPPLAIAPQWVTRLLAALERTPLCVVVADSAEALDELAAALAAQLARDTDAVFSYRSLIALDPGLLATQPAAALRDGLRAARRGILYLPNVARCLDASRSAGASVDVRRALARGDVRVFGTLDERDAGRLWPPDDPPAHELIYLDATGIDETIAIVRSRRDAIVARISTPALRFAISDAAIDVAARAADRYFRDPPPPGGAIRLILEAATAIKLRAAPGLDQLSDDRVEATPGIDPDDVLLALERLTGIEAQLDDQAKLLGIEAFLGERVVGQDAAVRALADAIRQARAGLKDPNRPIGSFIFMGPSGVGKTELAKALAEFMFGDADATLRLDMSEYHERHTIARLIGAPPGYVGYDEGGQLTEPIRRKPYQLVLFDEIEKAHPDVHNVLLQIMDDGRLTDSRGRTVDFRNTVVIMTGNVGSDYFRVEAEVGREKVVEAVREAAREVFRPEFLGRVDDFIVFNSLGADAMRRIVEIQIRQLNRKLGAQGLAITFSEALKEQLATTGYAPELGARPLRGEIRTRIERPLSRLIIEGAFKTGDTIAADVGGDGAVTFVETTRVSTDTSAAGG